MSHRKQIFAADDWGLSPGINEGILALARAGLLRSASCFGHARFLEHGLSELLSFGEVELWLHFDLTYGHGLAGLAIRSALGLLDPRAVKAEFVAQLGSLRGRGIAVAGVNGHHHVHLLPPVYDAMCDGAAGEEGLKLRMMRDRSHPSSYCQTKFFQLRRPDAGRKFTLEDCFYLRRADLASKEALLAKLARAGRAPLLSHPALFDDFDAVGMTDRLRDGRVTEFAAILEMAG